MRLLCWVSLLLLSLAVASAQRITGNIPFNPANARHDAPGSTMDVSKLFDTITNVKVIDDWVTISIVPSHVIFDLPQDAYLSSIQFYDFEGSCVNGIPIQITYRRSTDGVIVNLGSFDASAYLQWTTYSLGSTVPVSQVNITINTDKVVMPTEIIFTGSYLPTPSNTPTTSATPTKTPTNSFSKTPSTSTVASASKTPTVSLSRTAAGGRITGQIPYAVQFASQDTSVVVNLNKFFDSDTVNVVLDDYVIINNPSHFVFDFPPEQDPILTSIQLYDGTGTAANGVPIQISYRRRSDQVVVNLGQFDSSQYNVWTTLTVAGAGAAIDRVIFTVNSNKVNLPTEIRFIGSYLSYIPPTTVTPSSTVSAASAISATSTRSITPSPTRSPVPTGARVTGDIPYPPEFGYHDTTGELDFSKFWDGDLTQAPLPDYTQYLHAPSRFVFTFPSSQAPILSSMQLYDGAGSAPAGAAMELYYRRSSDKVLVSMGTFDGTQYNQWVVYNVGTPGVAIDQLVWVVPTNKAYLPFEIRLIGSYIPYVAPTYPRTTQYITNKLGINGYWYNVIDSANPPYVDNTKYQDMLAFNNIRYYTWVDYIVRDVDPRSGADEVYRFGKCYQGGSSLDDMLLKAKNNNQLALLTFMRNFFQYKATYQGNVPQVQGMDLDDTFKAFGTDWRLPSSWSRWGVLAFQVGLRYGNVAWDLQYSLAANQEMYAYEDGGGYSTKRSGLNYITHTEWLNEMDKSWKADYNSLRPYEMAMLMSVIADGHKGALGPHSGIKSADPNQKIVMGGLVGVNTGYVLSMFDTWAEIRGYNADGTINCPVDVFNFHWYSTLPNGTGISLENGDGMSKIPVFVKTIRRLAPNAAIWKTEHGYSVSDVGYYVNPSLTDRTRIQRQGDLLLRDAVISDLLEIDRTFAYQLTNDAGYDENKNDPYIPWDSSCGLRGNPAQWYYLQLKTLLAGYAFQNVVQSGYEGSNTAYIVRYTKAGSPTIYAVWSPTDTGSTVAYSLSLPGKTSLTEIKLSESSAAYTSTVKSFSGTYSSIAKETMVFLSVA